MAESELKARVKTLIGVALVGAVLLLSYEIFYWFTHVYESDVRVHTDFTDISSRVDGKIAEDDPARKQRPLPFYRQAERDRAAARSDNMQGRRVRRGCQWASHTMVLEEHARLPKHS